MADPLTKNGDFHEINSKILTDIPELQIHVKKWLNKSTNVKFKRGVSLYVEFDSTKKIYIKNYLTLYWKRPM